MKELKNKIVQLRKKMFIKEKTLGYSEETEYALKQEIFDLMKEEPNKEELARFWNNQFTGNYDG